MALKHEKINILFDFLFPSSSHTSFFFGFILFTFCTLTVIPIFFLFLVCGQMDLVLTDSPFAVVFSLISYLAEIHPLAVLLFLKKAFINQKNLNQNI